MICKCKCFHSVFCKDNHHKLFTLTYTCFGEGRVKIHCGNYWPPEEEKTILGYSELEAGESGYDNSLEAKQVKECKKCGADLFTDLEIEAGICQKCVMFSTDTPKPETKKKEDAGMASDVSWSPGDV